MIGYVTAQPAKYRELKEKREEKNIYCSPTELLCE